MKLDHRECGPAIVFRTVYSILACTCNLHLNTISSEGFSRFGTLEFISFVSMVILHNTLPKRPILQFWKVASVSFHIK
jgi:hypothetical protein